VTWAVSQGIDAALNEHYGWTIVPEELLEMAGSTMFGLAMLVAARDVVGSRSPAEHRAARVELNPPHRTLQPAR